MDQLLVQVNIHNRGLDPEINHRRWQKFLNTQNCPVCDCTSLTARKYAAKQKQPEHWRWICWECKNTWYKPFNELNTQSVDA